MDSNHLRATHHGAYALQHEADGLSGRILLALRSYALVMDVNDS